ncbi:WXG100 family type VII secretion target [Rhodococcus sp. PvR044]|uniref:WXG100 family type VII secretion target n=1 Tax=Rhodococcus sp. PvR044 TaxID=3156402 RepID=UPI00339484BA
MEESDLEVVPEEVALVGRIVRSAAVDLATAMKAVSGDVDALLSSWTGGASASYADGWAHVRDGADKVFEALGDMSELLGSTAEAYEQQEAATAESLSSLNWLS